LVSRDSGEPPAAAKAAQCAGSGAVPSSAPSPGGGASTRQLSLAQAAKSALRQRALQKSLAGLSAA